MNNHHADETPREFDMVALDQAIADMEPAQYAAELAATDRVAIAYAARRLGAEYLDRGDLITARRWYHLAAEHDPRGADTGLAEIEQVTDEQTQAIDPSGAGRARDNSPLQRFELFRSRNLDAVREEASRIFCPHSINIVGNKDRIDARLRSVRLRNISLSYVSYGCEVAVSPGTIEDFFTVQAPLSGRATVVQGSSSLHTEPTRIAVTSPAEPLNMHLSSDCTLLVCRIERTALEAQMSELLNAKLSAPLKFDLGMDLSRGMGRHWYSSLTGLAGFIEESGNTGSTPQFIEAIEQSLMTSLLLTQPSNYSDFLRKNTSTEIERATRRAIDLIQSCPESPHTTQSLARDIGVSVRSLQRAFQRQLGSSPTEYLREARLRRVHDELRARRSELTSVGEIAKRWGFCDTGRFSAVYRKRFGESPSETLKRGGQIKVALGAK